jgi:hypothetical protein
MNTLKRTSWACLALSFLAAAANAPAQARHERELFPIGAREMRVVAPSLVRLIGPGGEPQSQWIPVTPFDFIRDTPPWVVAWDSMNVNPATQVAFSDFYGPDAGPLRFVDTQRTFQWANDIRPNPVTGGRVARSVRVGLVWNPNGTNPRSGTAGLVVRIYAAKGFDSSAMGPAFREPLTGLEALFPNQAAGILELRMAIPHGVGLAVPRIPAGGFGSLVVEVGRIGSGNAFEQIPAATSPIAAQPLLNNLCAPGEPQFPGTNVSRSTELQWDDDTTAISGLPTVNLPNYVFEDFTNTGAGGYAELYGYDYTPDNLGILQATAALFVDDAAPPIRGTINFGGLDPSAPAPRRATLQIREATPANTLVAEWTVSLGEAGEFEVLNPRNVGGTYRISVKETHWLRTTLQRTIGAGSVSGLVFDLRNGDVDANNVVDLADFLLLASVYDQQVVNPVGDPPAWPDLTHDGWVSLSDFLVLAASYDVAGDPT